jgi:hypothetical protein
MSKFNYGDRVRVIKDKGNDDFRVGMEGILKERRVFRSVIDKLFGKSGVVGFAVEFRQNEGWGWFEEEELEKI